MVLNIPIDFLRGAIDLSRLMSLLSVVIEHLFLVREVITCLLMIVEIGGKELFQLVFEPPYLFSHVANGGTLAFVRMCKVANEFLVFR